MYLVKSDIMDEAAKRPGAHFDGMVGRLITQDVFPTWPKYVAPNLLSGSFELTSDGTKKPHSVRLCLQSDAEDGSGEPAPKSAPGPTSESIENEPPRLEEVRVHIEDEKSSTTFKPTNQDFGPASKPEAADSTGATKKEPEPMFLIPCCNNYARIVPPQCPPDPPSLRSRVRRFFIGFGVNLGICFAIGAIPLAIIGALSNFNAGSSTKAQRVWTMLWLAVGIWTGPTAGSVPSIPSLLKLVNSDDDRLHDKYAWQGPVFLLQWFFILAYTAPAIGGFIVVGQMLHSFGSRLRI
ncbi:hypothetical protein GJ744_008759 [Endocarpon pusillum]|uniref:Uncharacterized protein n=1 Tax=Endocarpon pusillum TaxID=364733 RepID=A0A8H7AQ88_9EURO|nr:hypothetical protein GJ744_008759 [Endocarpon pusillum]